MDPNSPESVSRCKEVIAGLNDLFLEQVPRLIQNGTAFISFHPMFALLEGLAGYRYPDIKFDGERFRTFVKDYLPSEYHGLEDALWDLRNGMHHAAVPRNFSLMHFSPQAHLTKDGDGVMILNAESLFEALKQAAVRYFEEVRTQPNLREAMVRRSDDPKGGYIVYKTVSVPSFGPQLFPPFGGGMTATGGISGAW